MVCRVTNRKVIVMKKLALQTFVTLVAALGLGSACIANDALARDHGGGGFTAGRMGGDFHAGQSGDSGLREGYEVGRISIPFTYGNYADNAHGFNCWKAERIPTNAAWRLRRAHTGTCY